MTARIDALDRNFIINGNFDFFQRSLGPITLDNVPRYSSGIADRFLASCNPTLTYVTSRSTDVPLNLKSRFSLKFAGTPAAFGDTIILQHRIEGEFLRQFLADPFSYNFFFKSGSAERINLSFNTANVKDDFSAISEFLNVNKVISVGGHVKVKEENFNLPANAINGVEIILTITDMSITGSSVDHFVSQMKFAMGEKVQEFSLFGRDLLAELSACQRYFEKSYKTDVAPTTNDPTNSIISIALNTTRFYDIMRTRFKEEKRVTPNMAFYNSITGTTTFRNLNASSNVGTPVVEDFGENSLGVKGFGIKDTGTSLSANSQFSVHYSADAEL